MCETTWRSVHKLVSYILWGKTGRQPVINPLFSLFLMTLRQKLKKLNAGVDISDGTVSILLYADDIALIAPSEKNLQKMLDTLSAWTDKWLMNIHPDKSQIVHFRKNDVDETKHCFKCGPIFSPITNQISYHLYSFETCSPTECVMS